MVPQAVSSGVRPHNDALQELDDLLEELSRVGQSDVSAKDYHAEWLGRATRGLGAVAGVVWTPAGDAWRSSAVVDQSGQYVVERLAGHAPHVELLAEIAREGRARLIAPGAVAGGDVRNPTALLLVLAPIARDGNTFCLAELLLRSGASPATHDGYLRFLEALCELAAEFHQHQRVRAWKNEADLAARRERFVTNLHASLDPQAVAATAANDGRHLLGCDRVSVVVRRRGRDRLLAVSGLDQIDQRSDFARRSTELARVVATSNNSASRGVVEPSVSTSHAFVEFDAWMEATQARAAAATPLARVGRDHRYGRAVAACGAMTFEWFGGVKQDAIQLDQVEWVTKQTSLAIERALEHCDLPLFPLVRALSRVRTLARLQNLPRLLLFIAALAAVAMTLSLVQTDFEVSGRGTLQPDRRREVFAGADGLVSELRVDHGSRCAKGELLLLLTRSQLDFEFSRVAGELQTTQTRLAVVQAALLESTPQTAGDRDRYHQLAGEESELKEQLASLVAQQSILRAQQAELKVQSPIDGTVITWNVRELLASRPVQRGQALLTVADLDGPWVLEIEVPDDKVGHVLAAQHELGAELDVAFILATDPSNTCQGTVQNVALSTDVGPSNESQVLITVRFDRNQVSQLRPGATVVPRIRCGRRSLGYVWFHGVWEAVQKYVLF